MTRSTVRRAGVVLVAGLAMSVPLAGQGRPRAREIGVAPGVFAPGAHNAITDVAGVRVGQGFARSPSSGISWRSSASRSSRDLGNRSLLMPYLMDWSYLLL